MEDSININQKEAELILLAFSNVKWATIRFNKDDRSLINKIFEAFPELKNEFFKELL